MKNKYNISKELFEAVMNEKIIDYIGDFCEKIKADSEQQAVFDACQWIIENKGS